MASNSNIHRLQEFQNAFELGLSKVHREYMDTIPRTYSVWLQEQSAKHFYDTDWAISGLGVIPEKEIGGVIEPDKIYQGPTKRYEMKTYAVYIAIQYEVFRWDLYGIFKPLMKDLGDGVATRYNLVAYSILNGSFASTDARFQTFQGEFLCQDGHTRLDGLGTWSNFDTAGFSYNALQQAVVDLRKLVNERGLFVPMSPERVMVAEEKAWYAKTILQTEGVAGTANKDINTLSFKQVHSSPYLTSITAWWVQCAKNKVRMHLRLGDSPSLQFDNDFRTMNRLGRLYCSFDVGIMDSRGLWGSTGEPA